MSTHENRNPDHPPSRLADPRAPAHGVVSIQLTACPDCGYPAEVVHRHVLGSSDGPIEHVRVRCVHGHAFLMPVELLAPARRP